MNILKLAKHLKEFTLDEIEMIAEVDCKTVIKQLLNEHKIEFKNGKYCYLEQEKIIDYELFIPPKIITKNILVKSAVRDFMQNYVQKYCKQGTVKNYNSIFKMHILPEFGDKKLKNISIEDVKNFYINCKNRNLCARRIKNALALLNQLIKYYQNLGVIDNKCTFQVKRITAKNEFNLNRIVFKENL